MIPANRIVNNADSEAASEAAQPQSEFLECDTLFNDMGPALLALSQIFNKGLMQNQDHPRLGVLLAI